MGVGLTVLTTATDAGDVSPKSRASACSRDDRDRLLIDYTRGIPERMIDLVERHAILGVWLNSEQCISDDLDAGVGPRGTWATWTAGASPMSTSRKGWPTP